MAAANFAEPGDAVARSAASDARTGKAMSTRSLEVTQAIRERVLNGVYRGGSRINEIELAAALGVSRTPIRGALSTLAAEGLLDYKPNCGYEVRNYKSQDIARIYEVRATLVGLATRLAAERGLDDPQRGSLHRALDETEQLLAGGGWDGETRQRWETLNRQFHDILNAAADNPFLVGLLRKSTDIPLVRHLRSQSFDAAFVRRSHEEHLEIADAVINREATRAEALGREHAYRSGRRLVKGFRAAEPDGEPTRRPDAQIHA